MMRLQRVPPKKHPIEIQRNKVCPKIDLFTGQFVIWHLLQRQRSFYPSAVYFDMLLILESFERGNPGCYETVQT